MQALKTKTWALVSPALCRLYLEFGFFLWPFAPTNILLWPLSKKKKLRTPALVSCVSISWNNFSTYALCYFSKELLNSFKTSPSDINKFMYWQQSHLHINLWMKVFIVIRWGWQCPMPVVDSVVFRCKEFFFIQSSKKISRGQFGGQKIRNLVHLGFCEFYFSVED